MEAKDIKTQAELDEHFKRCYTDFPYYSKHNLKIATKEDGLIPFTLNEVQLLLEDITVDIEARGLLVRLLILKARQEGVSTYSTGKSFWKTSNNKNKYAAIITHEPPATQELFNMQKRFYRNLEPEFKAETKYNNAKILEFNNDEGTGLDSSVKVATAGVKDFGSGQMIHFLHISELSKWPRENEEDLLTSLFQCVPDAKDTSIVIESTAKGVGGEFYKMYWAARYMYEIYLEDGIAKWKITINKDADPANIYSAIFIPWFVFKKYSMDVFEGFERTAEEKLLVKRFGISDRQLVWYRYVLANKCKGNKKIRDQEYPCTARSAFLGSGTPAFDIEQLIELKKKCVPPIKKLVYNHAKRAIIPDPEGNIDVWDMPRNGCSYLISADIAEGLVHGDFDSATVWNHMTKKQVAHFHGHMSPFKFAYLLFRLGLMYNAAWLVPERNNHGMAVVEKLLELEYPNIYIEVIPDPPHKPRKRFGWFTSKKNRPLIIDTLIDDVADGTHGICCPETFMEMMNFRRQDDGKIEADPGTFDDRVLDAAIGRYTLRTLGYVSGFSTRVQDNMNTAGVGVGGGNIQSRPSPSAYN